jgi:hypothetical protein
MHALPHDCIHSVERREMNKFLRIRNCSLLLIAIWGAFVALGTLFLEAYVARPGDGGTPTGHWLVESRIQFDDRRPNLLVFLHPHCPCSRASLGELAYIIDQCPDRVSVHAILLGTPVLDLQGRSEIERHLAHLPSVHVYPDTGGVEARRFGVTTSGHTLLFDPWGRLLFSGGITAARGHEGDNYGRAAVLERILNEERNRANSPVFGCPLATPRSTANEDRLQ